MVEASLNYIPEEKTDIEKATMRKVLWRLVPFLMLCYFMALLDRVNIGFAALQMNEDLGLTPSMFGFAASLYFVTYCAIEVPSNILMEKVGARIWIARIMVSWGLVAACMAFVQGPHSLYAMRMLLGAAEAGFFPGGLLLLTYWLPSEYKGRALALFTSANALSGFLGSPLSVLFLELDGTLGLRGWQWMFILEGLPTVLIGIAALFVLADSPAKAKWLSPEERAWLSQRMERERNSQSPVGHIPFLKLIRNKYFLAMALMSSGAAATSSVLAAWQPQILKAMHLTNLQVGFINSIPYGVAVVVMVLWARHSDRTQERRWHAGLPLAICGFSFVGLAIFGGFLLPTVFLLTLCLCGGFSFKGPFWALAAGWLSKPTMAAGIAGITAIQNLVGGGIMVSVVGVVKESTGSFTLGMMPIVAITLLGALLAIFLGRNRDAAP